MKDREILASLKIGDKIEYNSGSSKYRGTISKIRPKLAIGEAIREYEGYPTGGSISEETIRLAKDFYINGRKVK